MEGEKEDWIVSFLFSQAFGAGDTYIVMLQKFIQDNKKTRCEFTR